MATRLITMNDILAGHVSLDVACLDRHAVPSQRRQPATSRFFRRAACVTGC